MGWSISEVVNTTKVSKACAKELFEVGNYQYFKDLADVTYNGKLRFNPDHMECMDYVHVENIQAVLKKHKIKGDVCFGSLDGDNSGEFWGYRFDGAGTMTRLKGSLTFVEQG